MGKRHKKHDEDTASDDGMPVTPASETPASDEAPVVSDSDDGSTETETDAILGENEDDESDFA